MAVGTTNYPTSLDTVVELVEAANNAADTLSAGISAGDVSLTLADAAEFAASGIVAIENELLSYTGKSGSTLTGLTRGIEGTTAASHSSGADVRQVITAASHNVQSAAIIALEQKLGTGTDIAWSQMSPLTANRLVVTDGAGDVTTSALTHDATNAVIGNIGGLDFDTTPTATPTTARMVWDDTHGTVNLTLKGGTVGVDIGQTTVARVVNKTVTNINLLRSNYQVVRIVSAQGQRLAISLAQGDAEPNSTDVIGLVAEDIANNQEGFIVARGLITEINTTGSLQGETWADGDILYLSPTTAGGLTKVEPQAPDHLVIVGYVVYAHSQHGKIYVAIQTSWETKELHDVKITGTPVAGSLLIRNATTGVWENATLTAGSNISITNADKSITIAGTGGVASVTGTSPVVSSGGSTPAISLASGYGDTQNPYASKTANNFLAAPNGTAGAPTFRAIVAADIPTLNQNTTGTASNVTGTVAIANGGTGATTAPNALTNLGAYPASNPNGYTSNTGTVTSVGGTGTVNGITLTGSVSTTGNLTLGGTLSGVSLTTQVTGTLPIANGGTGQTTQQAALNALAGAATSGQYLRGNGTNVVMSAIQAGDVPTLNQNTTGTAANVTGVVAIANGGTGQTTRQDAMDALAGAVTAGQYLRGNGTDVVMSAIQVADVPTLNQNTTGTASNVTGTVAIANGGTGATTAGAARTNLGATTVGSNLFTLTNPSAVTFPRFNADNTVSALTDTAFRTAIGAGTVTGVTASSPLSSSGGATPNLSLGTVPVANGGTGVTTVSSGQLLIGTSSGGFAASTLTAGTGIAITNGSGTISIATTGSGGAGGQFVVKNTSGATASANDVGYIDSAGEYKTTNTPNFGGAWCVVVTGAANGSNITVARRGKVTVKVVSAVSAGDRLVTSSTAGSAQGLSYDHYNLFAVVLTGGTSTCEALLYTGSAFTPLSSGPYVYQLTGTPRSTTTQFAAKINGAPTTTTVNYNTLTGSADSAASFGPNELVFLKVWNSTRGTYRNATRVTNAAGNGGGSTGLTANQITTVATTDAWASGDDIQINSTVVTVGGVWFFTLELKDTNTVPSLARTLAMSVLLFDTANDKAIVFHPHETFGAGKQQFTYNGMSGTTYISNYANVPLINRRMEYRTNATAQQSYAYLLGAYMAVP